MNTTSAATTEPARKTAKPNKKDDATVDELRGLGYRVEKHESGWSAWEIHGDGFCGPASSPSALATQVKLQIDNRPQEAPPAIEEGEDDIGTPEDANPEDTQQDSGEEGGPETETLTHDSTGQAYIPGAEPVVIAELSRAVIDYHKCKLDRVALSNRETELKKTLKFLMHKHEDQLETDEAAGVKIYTAGDVVAKLVITEQEAISTETVKPQTEPRKPRKV